MAVRAALTLALALAFGLLLLGGQGTAGAQPLPWQCDTKDTNQCNATCYAKTVAALQSLHQLLQTNRTKLSNIDGVCLDKRKQLWPGYCCRISSLRCCCFNNVSCEGCSQNHSVEWLQLRNQQMAVSLGRVLAVVRPLMQCGLKVLNLEGNSMTGSLQPLADLVDEMRGMTAISLGDNRLTGTIPPALGFLTGLEHLALDANRLSGSVPPGLCGRASRLRDIYLRGNRLSGGLAFDGCYELINLDVQENDLTGAVPASPAWHMLHTLRIGNNSFDRISDDFYLMPSMLLLDSMANKLQGALSESIQDLALLTNIYLEANSLSGPLPDGLFHLKRLSYVYLGFNQFTGTIPAHIGDCTGLMALSLRSNRQLSGPIPESTGRLKYIAILDIVGTSMHGCHPDGSNMPGHTNCLPNFVRFSGRRAPPLEALETRGADVRVSQDTIMRCETLETNLDDERGRLMPRNTSWQVPPSYYSFRTCVCPEGFQPHWFFEGGSEWQTMGCTQAASSAVYWGVGAAVVVALMLLAWGWFNATRS